MMSVEDQARRYNGDKLAGIMLQLFQDNNTHLPASEAELSDYYKSIMLNREVSA